MIVEMSSILTLFLSHNVEHEHSRCDIPSLAAVPVHQPYAWEATFVAIVRIPGDRTVPEQMERT